MQGELLIKREVVIHGSPFFYPGSFEAAMRVSGAMLQHRAALAGTCSGFRYGICSRYRQSSKARSERISGACEHRSCCHTSISHFKTFMAIVRNEATGAIPELNATNSEIASLALAITRRSMLSQSGLKYSKEW